MNVKSMLERGGHTVYPIGFTFQHLRGKKHVVNKTIIDYSVGFNTAGKVVKYMYIVEYEFLGCFRRESIKPEVVHAAIKVKWSSVG